MKGAAIGLVTTPFDARCLGMSSWLEDAEFIVLAPSQLPGLMVLEIKFELYLIEFENGAWFMPARSSGR